ncbi:MAG: glycosyltransferase family 4 protein [Nanoarchaeota archaeon]|nr:glycosyltransferase family 4 protein [Nanoarchaeota archaeon]MBU1270127.1 glycosyltransferase family 4 protein [Nanoarchaeota archaeon]MBU1604467.1 glycosyltransferase family 4 protein [Nanoarchaeota archaeon]MBU2443476.1 glycosyltransferase family 4 protein [Nanoarchaeota archaeon]
MNILFLTEYFPQSDKGEISGGVEARCFYLAKELSKNHKIIVVTSWRKRQKRVNKIGTIIVERVGPNHKYSNKGSIFSRLLFAIYAYKRAKIKKADVVDGFNFTTYIPAYFAAKKINAKKIATYHETWVGEWIKNKGLITGLIGELLERITLKLKWDLIIAVSNFTKEKLEQTSPELNKRVVYNGVMMNDFEKIKTTKDEGFRIVCVSRLIKTKRQETILKALKELKDEEITAVFVGDGDDKEYFKKRIKEFKLEKQVRFTGFLKTKEEVIKEIKKSHVLVHPSAVEGFGITVIEGMAAGVPVICSDIEPLKEVTNNGLCGLIFKLDDYKELAEKIKTLKNDKEKYEEMKEKGLKRAKEFEWKTIAKEYEKAIIKKSS